MSAAGNRTVRVAVAVFLLTAAVGVGFVVGTGSSAVQNDGNAGDATAVRQIDGCTQITRPGTYVLTDDVTDGGSGDSYTYISESCIEIRSSDVVLDGDGHLVGGRGTSDTTGVAVESDEPLRNVTVRDLRTTDWNRGVSLRNVDDATVRNVNASGNTFGVFVDGSRGVAVRESTVRRAFIGVYAEKSDVTVSGGTLEGNHVDDVVRDDAPGTPGNGTATPETAPNVAATATVMTGTADATANASETTA